MIKLAILDETLNAQVATNKEDTQNLEIVYSENNLRDFLSKASLVNPKVLIIDLKYLEEYANPLEKLQEVIKLTKIEFCIVVYNYAKRELIQSLETKQSKTVKKPVTLKSLKVHMLGLILEEISKERQKREDNKIGVTKSNPDKPISNNHSIDFKTNIKYIISRLSALESYSDLSDQGNNNVYNLIVTETKKAKNIMNSALEKIEA